MSKADGFWRRWEDFFTAQGFRQFRDAQETPLPKVIRVNTLRNSVDGFLEWVNTSHPDWQLVEHAFGQGIFLIDRDDRSVPLGNTLGHIEGRFYIQEASSCLPPLALNPEPGETILDMAAAPGSKTTQLAGLMRGSGLLVANELVTSRTKKLVFNLLRCGAPNSVITGVDGVRFGEALPDFFDAILLDAPCSGEGTYRKDRAALDVWSQARIEEMAYLQESLLDSAWRALKPGGRLVYSTCTLAPEENERVVSRLLQKTGGEAELIDLQTLFSGADKCPGLTEWHEETFPHLDKTLRIWPHVHNSEGFFVAALRKSATTLSLRTSIKKQNRLRELGLSKKEATEIREYLKDSFTLFIPEDCTLIKRESEKRTDYWLMPSSGIQLLSSLPVSRPGIRVAEKHGKKFKLDHEFAVTFGAAMQGKRVLEVADDAARKFLCKENLSPESIDTLPEGDIVIRHHGIPLGTAKKINDMLKNSLPIHFANAEIS